MTTLALRTLAQCEAIIEQSRSRFAEEAGPALVAILDGRLYLETHKSFERYLLDRWGISKSHGYRIVQDTREALEAASERETAGERVPLGDKGKLSKPSDEVIDTVAEPVPNTDLLVGINEVPVPPDDTLPREDQPADGQADTAAEHARGTSPSHAGSASARGARGPANERVAPDQGPGGNGTAGLGGVHSKSPQAPPALPPARPAPGKRTLRAEVQDIAASTAESLAECCELAELRDARDRLDRAYTFKISCVAPQRNGSRPASSSLARREVTPNFKGKKP